MFFQPGAFLFRASRNNARSRFMGFGLLVSGAPSASQIAAFHAIVPGARLDLPPMAIPLTGNLRDQLAPPIYSN